MGKWFGQAAEIEALRAENHQLRGQVESLEARLRAAYGEAGITALSQEAPAPSGGGEAGPTVPPVGVGVAELTEAERALVASGRKIAAIKAYKDRTGADLLHAKELIDEAAAIKRVSPDLTEEELALVASGRTVEAVKAYKDRTGVSLRQAKAAIDAAR